jgi:hypothetical protein
MALDSLFESARRAIAGTSADAKGKAPEPAEEARRPLLQRLELSSRQSFGAPLPVGTYGATEHGSHSTTSLRSDGLHRVPEEEEEGADDDWPEGMQDMNGGENFAIIVAYSLPMICIGSWRRTVALYTLVPITSVAVLGVLAILPILLWRTPFPSAHPPLLPYPLPALLLAASLWTLSHVLQLPTYTVMSALLPSPLLASVLSTAFFVLFRDILRLLAVPLVFSLFHMPHTQPEATDPAFSVVWFFALGWSGAEVLASVAQGFEQLLLYKDAPRFDVEYTAGHVKGSTAEASPLRPLGDPGMEERRWMMAEPAPVQTELELERELDHLVALKARQELEEVYGMPVVVSVSMSTSMVHR